MLELGLTDIWREANPDCKRYTWRKTKPLKQSRLDYFLLSDYLVSSYTFFQDIGLTIQWLSLSFALEKKWNKTPFGNLTAHYWKIKK